MEKEFLIISFTAVVFQLIIGIFLTGIIVYSDSSFGKDINLGVQKNHLCPTSRLGGVSVATSIYLGIFFNWKNFPNDSYLSLILMFAFMPIFLGGLIEDITNKVSARTRLVLSFITAILTYLITKAGVNRADIFFIDWILQYHIIFLFITILLIAGFINSVNLIDGFNGLASGTILITLIGLGILAILVGDVLLFRLCLIVFIADLAFFVWNWPYGKIFLGDSGAYLLGVWTIELGILLIYRNNDISPFAPLVIGAYPLIETIFSMYRRKLLRNKSITQPDRLHLHTLIYKRLLFRNMKNIDIKKVTLTNSKVSFFIWIPMILFSIIAICNYGNTSYLIFTLGCEILLYVFMYKLIVRFSFKKFFINNFF